MGSSWVIDLLGLLARWAVGVLAGVLLSHHVMTEGEIARFSPHLIYGLTFGFAALGWMAYRKYKARVELLTGLALPPGSSIDDVKAAVKAGAAPPVSTPNSAVPKPTPTSTT